ncbi:MAG: flagellar hook-associated protein FlgK [Sulfurimonas sp.]|nr:flagellar hook-associated protein FlgK [Sulfurimonas sp.]
MASIFNTLNIGYTGLNAAAVGVNTTSQNISNAETEGYTRQRVIQSAATPISSNAGQVGNGTSIENIQRIFDNFVFDRYTAISDKKEYADFAQRTLDELSTYFPEIDGIGIKSDLTNYYDMWQTFADNPDNDAIKLALAQQTVALTENIQATQNKVVSLQKQLNDQLLVNVNEVNSLIDKLANINKSIAIAESGDGYTANDLRDKRNVLERSIIRLIGGDVNVGQMSSNIQIDSSSNIKSGSYTLTVNGFNIVDGSTSHKIHMENKDNANGFHELFYERQDGVLISMESSLTGGRVGAILDLRGSSSNDGSTSGVLSNGIVQDTINQLDAFAAGLIEATNNIYAQSSTNNMTSNILDLNPTNSLVNSNLNINSGSFSINIYDIDGNITATRDIVIDEATVMTGAPGSNSIQGQIEANLDDNSNSSGIDDIDDFLQFNWATYASGDNAMELFMDPGNISKGYKFSIEDKLVNDKYASGTNFAGALGLSRFFDGDSATNISLNSEFKDNPTNISAGKSPVSGDNTLSLNIVQQQFEVYNFEIGTAKYETTMYGMFDIVATDIGTKANSAILHNETITAQFNAIELEYQSISKVSIDEEMTNLIKYQSAYGASAKIITTIDQMMQTLLGIKQ